MAKNISSFITIIIIVIIIIFIYCYFPLNNSTIQITMTHTSHPYTQYHYPACQAVWPLLGS